MNSNNDVDPHVDEENFMDNNFEIIDFLLLTVSKIPKYIRGVTRMCKLFSILKPFYILIYVTLCADFKKRKVFLI
uniref:Uncharacterized protein n=1 Tax=Strongyloides papillosus TaxID=174720 RepID=A0A0N5CAE5_STREA